ncbi:MAG: threonine synthase [Christensenellales bacterium]|jgi:threonine synthase
MRYISTRGSGSVSPSDAVLLGIAPDGGLFVPEQFPQVYNELSAWRSLPYEALCAKVLSLYFTDFTQQELLSHTTSAYRGKFPAEVVPVRGLGCGPFIMELWQGPTLAFKDMALQVLPRLLSSAMDKTGEESTVLILVATSGDTGKAALEGFSDVPRTAISVYYPKDGVSATQRLQMVTQQGTNVHVCAVRGNFDDAQTSVKEIFGDTAFSRQINEKGYRFSSANSINWGRLAPQIAYYFWAYFNMAKQGGIRFGDAINVAVPTGNFGNILAAWYAKKMGLPIKNLICASNRNNILTDFFQTGVYDRRREFYRTLSPSMDILISSNLERMLFEAVNRDSARLCALMDSLKQTGFFEVDQAVGSAFSDFYGGYLDDTATKAEIARVFREYGYLMDTHTAVAHGVYRSYVNQTGDHTPTVLASTASPFKFAPDVLSALGEVWEGDELAACTALSKVSGLPLPAQVASLNTAPILHGAVCDKTAMRQDILSFLSKDNP